MDKVNEALCTATGIMEARAELYMEDKRYKDAKDVYRDLLYIHRTKPLSISGRMIDVYKAQIAVLDSLIRDKEAIAA